MNKAYTGTNGNDILSIPHDMDDDSGVYVAGLGGDDLLFTGNQDDIEDFVSLYGGSGNDTYVMNRESCTFVADTSGHDTVSLPFTVSEFIRYSPYGYSSVVDGAHYYLEFFDMKLLVTNFAGDGKIETIAFKDGVLSFDQLWGMHGNAAQSDSSYDQGPMMKYLFDRAMNRKWELAAQENAPAVGAGDKQLAFEVYFDEDQYLQNKADALNAQRGPFSPLFWADSVEDAIEAAGMTPLQHFMIFGAFERNAQGEIGIDPSNRFDVSTYYAAKAVQAAANGEVLSPEIWAQAFQNAGVDPVSHFALWGYAEGLVPQPVEVVGAVGAVV